tara:strand:- start:16 stop:531 length:516 start_codon:yes stop_codon:yes gene_type:complete
MAGSLVLIDSESVTSGVASVTLTGIDSTYNVYVVTFNNVECSTDVQPLYLRVTTSGTADSDSEYDYAISELKSYSSGGTTAEQNVARWYITYIGTPAQEQANGVMHLYNFSNASGHSFYSIENTNLNSISKLSGAQGGGVHTVNEANDGVSFYMDSGNIDNGEFKLYGLRK